MKSTLPILNSDNTCINVNVCVLQLYVVLHTQAISFNLIYVKKLCDSSNNIVEFHTNEFFIQDAQTSWVDTQTKASSGLYIFGGCTEEVDSKNISYYAFSFDSTHCGMLN